MLTHDLKLEKTLTNASFKPHLEDVVAFTVLIAVIVARNTVNT